MKIPDLITLAENKLMVLNRDMATAVQLGEVEEIPAIEAKVVETQVTLDALRSIQ